MKDRKVIDAVTTAIIDYPTRWIVETVDSKGDRVRWTTSAAFTYEGIIAFVREVSGQGAAWKTEAICRSDLPVNDESLFNKTAKLEKIWEK